MSGAPSVLNLKGNQDLLLTNNPEIPITNNEYKQYEQLACEINKLEFKENVDFGKKISCMIPNKGEYLGKINFYIELPALSITSGTYVGWTNSIGHAIIEYVDLYIGETLVDKHYGMFLEIWEELTGKNKEENLSIGKYSILESLKISAVTDSSYLVPLRFWFCRDISTIFPIHALKYHKIRIDVKLREFSECVTYDGVTPPQKKSIKDCYLSAEYYFTNSPSIKSPIVKNYRILISQVQYKDSDGEDVNYIGSVFKTKIPFNHPVKEILWVFRETDSEENNDWFNFSKRSNVPSTEIKSLMKNTTFYIEGVEYTKPLPEKFYRLNNKHTNITDRHIYSLSFCENPENFQPSGTLNFSVIDNFYIRGDMNTPTPSNKLYAFGISYNWLEIENGISRLLFIS